MRIAKVFFSGCSQAVRIPHEYRFEDEEVSIRREGEALILEPIKKQQWPRNFWQKICIQDTSFKRPEQGTMPMIQALDKNEPT